MEAIFDTHQAHLQFRHTEDSHSTQIRLILGDSMSFLSDLQGYIIKCRDFHCGKRTPMILHNPMTEKQIIDFVSHFQSASMEIYIPVLTVDNNFLKKLKTDFSIEVWELPSKA